MIRWIKNAPHYSVKCQDIQHFHIFLWNESQHGDYLVNKLPLAFQGTIARHASQPTANCAVVFDKSGDAKLYLANMDIHKEITPAVVSRKNIKKTLIDKEMYWWFRILFFLQIIKNETLISKAPLVVFDSNITVDAMGTVLELCKKYNRPGQ